MIDPAEAVRKQLSELDLETRAAERDYRQVVLGGDSHMRTRYPAQELARRPDDLDHYAFHFGAHQAALEDHGLVQVPPDPYENALPKEGVTGHET